MPKMKSIAQPHKPTEGPKVEAPSPTGTNSTGPGVAPANVDLVRMVADLAAQVTEQGAKTTEAVDRLNVGLEAFGRVAEAVDRLTTGLADNMKFVREQQVRIRQRQRVAAAEFDRVVVQGGDPRPPAPGPEDVE